jgi:hypothetical protein
MKDSELTVFFIFVTHCAFNDILTSLCSYLRLATCLVFTWASIKAHVAYDYSTACTKYKTIYKIINLYYYHVLLYSWAVLIDYYQLMSIYADYNQNFKLLPLYPHKLWLSQRRLIT